MPHVRIRRDDNEKNGILVNDGEMKEKGGEIQVNILSSKSWTKVKQWTKKAWAGYRQKGEVGRDENWEVRKLQRVLYPMTRGGGGGGVQFSCHGYDEVFSCSCSQRSSLVGRLQHECRFGSFPEFESGSLLSLKWIFRIWIADRDYSKMRIEYKI